MTLVAGVQRVLAASAVPLALAACGSSVERSGIGDSAAAATAGGSPSVPAARPTAPLTPTSSGYADVPDGRVFYQVYGTLPSAKHPLLVLHGSFMSGDAMEPIVRPFTASRPVITIDARDHGRSGDTPGPLTYERMADDAAAVLATLRVAKADVLGYSMGGTTALFLASRHADQVDRQVILAGTSARAGWYPEVIEGMSKVTPAAMAGTPIEAESRRLSPTPAQFPDFVRKVIGLELVDYVLPDAAVRAIPGKTMIVVGDADGVRLEHAMALFALRGGGDREAARRGFIAGSPRARLAILPATSHVGLMARGDQIAALAVPFLDDEEPPRVGGFFEGMDVPPPASAGARAP